LENYFRPEALKLIFQFLFVGGGSALASGWPYFPFYQNLLMCALSTHIGMLSPLSHHIMVPLLHWSLLLPWGFQILIKNLKTLKLDDLFFGSLILIGLTSSWIYTEPSEIRQMTSNNLGKIKNA